MQAARQSFNNGGKRGKFIICLGCYPDVNVFSWILKNSHKYHSSKNKKKIWCTELLGYTQLTQCIDKSRFILPLPFAFTFNCEPTVPFSFFSKTYPITSYPFTRVNLTLTQCHVRLTILSRNSGHAPLKIVTQFLLQMQSFGTNNRL